MADRYSGMNTDFAGKVKEIEAQLTVWCSKHWVGHQARMSEGYRTVARQKALYAQGRTAPGEIVTQKNGTTNKSNHQSGRAADIVGVDLKGNLTWDCPSAFWEYLGHLARAQGLVWGGSWPHLKDMPHVEMPAPK